MLEDELTSGYKASPAMLCLLADKQNDPDRSRRCGQRVAKASSRDISLAKTAVRYKNGASKEVLRLRG
jgi:hypothetical protein